MAKRVTKAEASQAGKTLGSDRASAKNKAAAAGVLAQARKQKQAAEKKKVSEAARTLAAARRSIKSPKGKGTVKMADVERAVKKVMAARGGAAGKAKK